MAPEAARERAAEWGRSDHQGGSGKPGHRLPSHCSHRSSEGREAHELDSAKQACARHRRESWHRRRHRQAPRPRRGRRGTQAVIKHMKSGGRVINIGSCNAERMPFVGGATYAMSKAALVGLVKGLARDLGPRGITVNNVQPGPVDTDLNPADSDFATMLRQLLALPRYGAAEEIAALVASLAGPEAGFITGASLTIDGGFTA